MKLTNHIDKFGTAGLFLTALFSPCCFPLFAFVASALGLGSFELFGGWTMVVFQAMVLISIGGFYVSYRTHRVVYPLLLALMSGLVIFYAYHLCNSDYYKAIIYLGMSGLLIATIWNSKVKKVYGCAQNCSTATAKKVVQQSVITCPECEHQKEEIMPADSCTFFYECDNCHVQLKPLKGDCCVYCSYGSVNCPPVQTSGACC